LEKNFKTEDDVKLYKNKFLLLKMENDDINNDNEINININKKLTKDNLIFFDNDNDNDIDNDSNNNIGNRVLGKMFSFEFDVNKN
jgi:hypothetical protein